MLSAEAEVLMKIVGEIESESVERSDQAGIAKAGISVICISLMLLIVDEDSIAIVSH